MSRASTRERQSKAWMAGTSPAVANVGSVQVRAAPKRKKPSRFREGFFVFDHRVEEVSVFGRPGSDLLFQALRLSIIRAGEFNGRVRDGIGYRLPASTTRSAKNGKR